MFFRLGNSSLKKAIARGAVILDVRTAHEFDQGRIKGSINIPLDRLPTNLQRLHDIGKPIIVVCLSGVRSRQAMNIMKAAGIKDVWNGGSWAGMLRLIKKLDT